MQAKDSNITSDLAFKAIRNSQGQTIELHKSIVCSYLNMYSNSEIELLVSTAIKLPDVQLLLWGDCSLDWIFSTSNCQPLDNLFVASNTKQIEELLSEIDLLVFLSAELSYEEITQEIYESTRPKLYFQSEKDFRHLNNSHSYVISAEPDLDLLVSFIQRFLDRSEDKAIAAETRQSTAVADFALTAIEEDRSLDPLRTDYSIQGQVLQEQGDIEGAVQSYYQAIQVNPQQSLWVFINLVSCLELLGQFSQAVEIAKRGLKIYPEAALYRWLGLVHDRQGHTSEVITNYAKAIELDRNQPPWVYYVLSIYYHDGGKYQAAIDVAQKGIEIYPKQASLYRCLGVIADKQDRLDRVITYYQQAIELDPQQPFWLYCALMERLRTQQRHEAAVKVGEQGIKIHSEQAELYRHLGISQSENHNIEAASQSYQQAISLEPKQPEWMYLELAESLLSQEQLNRAIKVIQQASQQYPAARDSFRSCYHKLIEIKLDDLDLFLKLGAVLENNDEIDEALAIYHRGLQIFPDEAQLRENLERLAPPSTMVDGNAAQTEKKADLATVSIFPEWKTYYDRGNELQSQGNLEDAIAAYQQSIFRNPYHSWSYHNLADTLIKLGRWEDAIIFYQRALEINPNYFWSSYNLGVAYNNSGRWGEAIALYHRSIELNPSVNLGYRALQDSLLKRWHGMFVEGDKLLSQNKTAEAKAIFQQAIKLYREQIYLPQIDIVPEVPQHPAVILVVDDYLPQCLRYRVQQKIEQLSEAGIPVEYFPWREVKQAKSKLHFYHVVIFYRVPALPELIETIAYAKAIGKVVFYEIDDLIFDDREYPDPIESYGGQVSEEQYHGLLRGVTLFGSAMAMCDYGIASTPALAARIKPIVAQQVCFVHRNALDSHNVQFSQLNYPKVSRDYISIFYGSGTKAHNADFDLLVAPAIAKILQQYPQVRLTLMGYLTLPEILVPFQKQIDKVDLIKDVAIYWEFLQQADINIAVLLPTPVNNCKSELKWFEAGCLKVPSVVSNTQTYQEIVTDGIDAFVASNPDEWYQKLSLLIDSPQLRQQIAEAAYIRAWNEYSIPTMANNIKQIVLEGIRHQARLGNLKPRTTKTKLLIVNVFYPPQSIGGATRIVKDNVGVLQQEYGDKYEISVFTSDDGNPQPYEINQYSDRGVRVTKVSTPMMEGMDWQYENPRMYEIFSQYLEFERPDLIHFHCVQRLTASTLAAAADLKIPYVVTVHDAWWISDRQFLMSELGIECDYRQNDPVIAARDTNDIVSSLKRKRYLKERLAQAQKVLAVSEAFTDIYRLNGVAQAQANRNGIIPQPRLPRQSSPSGKVRLAHIGGMATHKGYFLFQEAVIKAQLTNCEIIVVDHAQVAGSVIYDSWENTSIKFIAKIPQTKIYEFYSTIDVLVAPSMWPESFGLVTREAAAAGVWVVASNKGALAEDLIPGINGDVCNPGNIEELVDILQKIDREPRRYQQLVKQNITIRTTEQQVKDLVNIYDSIV